MFCYTLFTTENVQRKDLRPNCHLYLIWLCFSLSISANCPDPGFPAHGNRTVHVSPARRPMDDGTVISFSCDPNYTLRGAKKIICMKGRWNGKKPICKASGMYHRFLKICWLWTKQSLVREHVHKNLRF